MQDRFGQLQECFEQKKEYFMINRTKIFTIALTGALAAAALTGCGGSSSSAAPSSVSTAAAESPASSAAASAVVDNAAENGSDALDGVFNALLEADPISNQFEIAAMNIEYDFGLKAEDVVSYKGVKSNDNGDAGLVLVLEAADGKAEDVANQLASYQQDQVAFYGNYAEFAQAQDNVENAVIAFKGNTVVMMIASNECTADLDSAVDSALAD
jgi:ABC-type transport system substrate-binding protein